MNTLDGITVARHQGKAAEVGVVGSRVLRWLGRERGFLDAGQRRPERIGDALRDFALDREDIGQGPIVGFGPKVAVGLRVDQLHIDANPVPDFWTLPSRICATPSCFAISSRFSGALL